MLVVSDEASRVVVSASGYERPALLSTSKEIRSEALTIFYHENFFRFKITNFDSTPLFNWHIQKLAMGFPAGSLQHKTRNSIDYFPPSWPDLLVWLHRYHVRAVSGRPSLPQSLVNKKQGHMLKHVVGDMFAAVDALHGERWALAEAVVKSMRPSLVIIDEDWAKD